MKLNKLKNERLFDFVITVPEVVDKEGERTPKHELDEALDSWLLNGAPITINHSNKIVGKGLRWWKEKQDNGTHYIARGLIFKNSELSDLAWQNIVSKKFKDVSIAGTTSQPTILPDGSTELRGLDVIEVALCEEGMHPDAEIIAVNELAKSEPKLFFKADFREVNKPFAEYKDFDDCVKRNQDKENPEGYCATIMRNIEGKKINKQNDPTRICGHLWFNGTEAQRNAFQGGTQGRSRNEKPPKEWWDDCIATIGKSNDFDLNKLNGGFEMKEKEVKKQDEKILESLSSLEAKLNQLLELLSAKPNQEPVLAEEKEEKEEEEEKPLEEKKEEKEDEEEKPLETEKQGTSETIKLPKTPQEETQGKIGEQEKDEISFLEKKLREIAKSEALKLLKKSETPRPTLNEKNLHDKSNEFDALAIARGKKLDWRAFNEWRQEMQDKEIQRILA